MASINGLVKNQTGFFGGIWTFGYVTQLTQDGKRETRLVALPESDFVE